MTLNLIKLCVGAHSIEDLARWQNGRLAAQAAAGTGSCLTHTTFQTPKRADEILEGGSLYWVIKGMIQVRQRLVGLDEGRKDNGEPCCLLILDPELVPVRPTPRRPFQGWRYLAAEDAPADLARGGGDGLAEMPPAMRRALADLCLI
ncbi:MAG: DUF1489 domain-containing protein [Hyphomicrobiaceae bacterium]|nr:DUF1489 domain-containing protein [Hyphomicrobiaceae bacterium]